MQFGLGIKLDTAARSVANSKGIRLSAASFQAGAAQDTAIGTLSVVGGTGTYTFTVNPADTHVQVAGTNGVNLQVGSTASSAGSFNITINANNGAGSTFTKTFLITVAAAPGGITDDDWTRWAAAAA